MGKEYKERKEVTRESPAGEHRISSNAEKEKEREEEEEEGAQSRSRSLVFTIRAQFAGVQAINTAILDLRPDLRKRESLVVLGICVTCWFLAIPMVFDGGIYLFTLMDWNTASWAILLIGIAEVGVVGWCYGCNKFLRNIAEMQMRFNLLLRRYWWLSWVVLAPITCLRDRSMFRPKKTWGPAVEKSKDTVSTASVKVSEPRGNETQENSPV